MFSFADNDIIIPIYAVEEIDNFKKELSELGQNARQVSRYLDELRGVGSLAKGVKLESGGTLALPAFSVGRTQDLLFDIHYLVAEDEGRYGAIKYLLDSPTSVKVNAVTLEALKKTQLNPSTGKSRPLWMGKQVFRELGLDKNNREHFDFALDICSMTLGHLDQSDFGLGFFDTIAYTSNKDALVTFNQVFV